MCINILWADQDYIDHLNSYHLDYCWGTAIKFFEKKYNFKITKLHSVAKTSILKNCFNKQILVIHCGTIKPMADLQEVLLAVKNRFPNIKVGLETNTKHPVVENLVDFYIEKPLRLEELREILEMAIK